MEYFENVHSPYFEKDPCPSNTPLIILLHGVSGSSKAPYLEQVWFLNWDVLVSPTLLLGVAHSTFGSLLCFNVCFLDVFLKLL